MMVEHPLDQTREILDAEEVVVEAEYETIKASRAPSDTLFDVIARMTVHMQRLAIAMRDLGDAAGRLSTDEHDF
jgi:hypothetical protein